MKQLFVVVALMSASFVAHASCDDVKSSIDAKIKANNVSNYTLEVVSKDQAGDGKVVGQCSGDKVIVYTRGQADKKADDASKAPAADTAAPASSSSSGK
jgi:hypothetical protein